MKRVGNEYPHPRVNDGRRKLWLRDDLDQAILPITGDQNMMTRKRPRRRHDLHLRLDARRSKDDRLRPRSDLPNHCRARARPTMEA